jgi:hypothetical protein
MTDPKGLTGKVPFRCGYTAMQPTAPRRRGFIHASDGTDTSKCPYIDVCNQPRCRAITADIRLESGPERCIMQDAIPCTPEEVAR